MKVTKIFLADVGGGAIRVLRVRPNAFAANYPPNENGRHPRRVLDGNGKVPRRLNIRVAAPEILIHQDVADVDGDARLRDEVEVVRGYNPSPREDWQPEDEWSRRVLENLSARGAKGGRNRLTRA